MKKEDLLKMNSFNNLKFSERLKELRKQYKLTQNDLADIFGYNRTTISHWESSSKEPSYLTLAKISIFFNVSVDYLLGLK